MAARGWGVRAVQWGLGGAGWGVGVGAANGYEVSLVIKMFWNWIAVMAAQSCEYTKNH